MSKHVGSSTMGTGRSGWSASHASSGWATSRASRAGTPASPSARPSAPRGSRSRAVPWSALLVYSLASHGGTPAPRRARLALQDDFSGAELGDPPGAVAVLGEHLVGVLALARGRRADAWSHPRELQRGADDGDLAEPRVHRSEEHTSELQSRLHLVCRLLLEKKKK